MEKNVGEEVGTRPLAAKSVKLQIVRTIFVTFPKLNGPSINKRVYKLLHVAWLYLSCLVSCTVKHSRFFTTPPFLRLLPLRQSPPPKGNREADCSLVTSKSFQPDGLLKQKLHCCTFNQKPWTSQQKYPQMILLRGSGWRQNMLCKTTKEKQIFSVRIQSKISQS